MLKPTSIYYNTRLEALLKVVLHIAMLTANSAHKCYATLINRILDTIFLIPGHDQE